MLLNIVLIVVVLLGALLALGATRPGTFRVQLFERGLANLTALAER